MYMYVYIHIDILILPIFLHRPYAYRNLLLVYAQLIHAALYPCLFSSSSFFQLFCDFSFAYAISAISMPSSVKLANRCRYVVVVGVQDLQSLLLQLQLLPSMGVFGVRERVAAAVGG